MYKWKLMVSTLPVPLVAITTRFLMEYFARAWGSNYTGIMDFSTLSPILTGGVFLIGLMLSGTLQDYKESEKIPAELACCLESIEETASWVSANRPAVNDRAWKEIIAKVTAEIIAWLLRQRTHAQGFAALEKLNVLVRDFDKLNAGLPAARLMAELHNLRKTVTRIGVISRTGFLASGYALLDILVAAVLLLLLFASYKSEFGVAGKYIIIGFVSLIYSYLWRLVKDVDDPFEYSPDGERTGAAEVELFPLIEYQQRARERLAASDPGGDAAPGGSIGADAEGPVKTSGVAVADSRRRATWVVIAVLGLIFLLVGGGLLWRFSQTRGATRKPTATTASVPAAAPALAPAPDLAPQVPVREATPTEPAPAETVGSPADEETEAANKKKSHRHSHRHKRDAELGS